MGTVGWNPDCGVCLFEPSRSIRDGAPQIHGEIADPVDFGVVMEICVEAVEALIDQ